MKFEAHGKHGAGLDYTAAMQSISISKWPGQADVHENPSRRIRREIPRVNGIDRRELRDRRAIDVAFEDSVQGRACSLQAQFHLLRNELGLWFDRRVDDRVSPVVSGR